MTKQQYDEIDTRLFQLMADASLVAELLRNARCGILADKVLSICTDAGSYHSKWKKIEPNWNTPASDDCHTFS